MKVGKVKYSAVRWPRALQQALKVAAAAHNPPLTMSEYLVRCFDDCQKYGGPRAYAAAHPPKEPE